jgi:hypothetical protein
MSTYRFELKGGPLAGRQAAVTDTEVRLAVVREDRMLYLEPSDRTDVPRRSRPIGHYGFSHREEALVWFPAVD